MQQVTLNIPNEKMPAFRQFLQVLETGKHNKSETMKTDFLEKPTPAKFHPYYDWEFFMSELEYE